jgi:hypothetical protein
VTFSRRGWLQYYEGYVSPGNPTVEADLWESFFELRGYLAEHVVLSLVGMNRASHSRPLDDGRGPMQEIEPPIRKSVTAAT